MKSILPFWYAGAAFLCAGLMLWSGAPLWLFGVAVVVVLGMLAVEHATQDPE